MLHAWGGIAGAQTTLPLLLGEDRLPPERVAEVLAGFPARRLRLAAQGPDRARRRRRPRARRPRRRATSCAPSDLHQRHRVSPFVGRTLRARVVRTILRGRTVFADGRLVGEPRGRLVVPA